MRSVLISSCPDLLLGLDLTGLNPTRVPITFVHSANVTVDYIRWGTIITVFTRASNEGSRRFHNHAEGTYIA